jgi:hypothetical protein
MNRRKFLAQSACSTFLLVEPWASWCKAQMCSYYRPLDLVEKVLNCRQVIETLQKS